MKYLVSYKHTGKNAVTGEYDVTKGSFEYEHSGEDSLSQFNPVLTDEAFKYVGNAYATKQESIQITALEPLD